MRNKFSFFIVLSIAVIGKNASAQIPTTDAAAVAQSIQMVEQARMQLIEIRQGYESARNEFKQNVEFIKGNNFNDLVGELDKMALDYLPTTDWRSIETLDVTSLRNRYGLVSTDSVKQDYYDSELRRLAVSESVYKAQAQRLKNVEALKRKAAGVITPQQRGDLANAIAVEAAAIEADNNRMKAMSDNMQADKELRDRQANQKLANFFGR